jgi:hypothetical protein
MLTFLTLFLGLVSGTQSVELQVPAESAVVEVRLDGELHAELREPPWEVRLDLGPLRPHHLTATARSSDGALLGRSEQWINLSRARAQATWVIEESDPSGWGLRLHWESVEHAEPSSVVVRVDGEKVTPRRGDLNFAVASRDQLHLVSAELTFADGQTVRADALISDEHTGRTAAELTAVAVIGGGHGLRRPAQARGRIRLDGQDLEVFAVDRGAADLAVVADRTALEELRRLRHGVVRRAGGRLRPHVELVDGVAQRRLDLVGVDYGHPVVHAGSGAGDRLFFVRPIADRSEPDAVPYDLFGVSHHLVGGYAGPAWQLTNTNVYEDSPDRPQRLADAVARAGLVAYSGGRPRAVVLILGPEWKDSSLFSPSEVAAFLGDLRVPLYVWRIETAFDELSPEDKKLAWEERELRQQAVQSGESEPPPGKEEEVRRIGAAWGPPRVIESAGELVSAATDVRRELGRQRILWVEGRHLPQSLEVAEP